MIRGLDAFSRYLSAQCGISPEKAKKIIVDNLKTDDTYPTGDLYEKNISQSLEKLCQGYRELDKYVEENPLPINEFFEELGKIPEKMNLSHEELGAIKVLGQVLGEIKGGEKEFIAAARAAEVEEGAFIHEFNKALPLSLDKPVNDFMENEPAGAFFVDVTPGEPGLKALYINFDEVRKIV